MTSLDELRAAGRRIAEAAARRVWRRVPISQRARYHLQAWFPRMTGRFSVRTEPPHSYARPPERVRTAVERSDGRALGYREPGVGKPMVASGPRIVATFVVASAEARFEASRARPQFEGHAQPRLSHEAESSLRAQVELARAHGISAFAFEAPGEASLAAFRAEPTLPLAYCVVWIGDADAELVARLAPHLADPRYLRVDGKAVLVIASPERVDRARARVTAWCELARKQGLGELLVVGRQTAACADPVALGFHAAIAQPLVARELTAITARQRLINPAYCGEVLDARTRADRALPARTFAAVSTGWDDEPSRPGAGRVVAHGSPRRYGDELRGVLLGTAARGPSGELVFVDAWNDWRHGGVLLPDTRLGHAYLEATRDAILAAAREVDGGQRPAQRPCAVVHVYYLELLDEIARALVAAGLDWRLIVTTQPERVDAVRARLAALGLAAEVEAHENRGRDILPFLRVANRLHDEGVDVVLKLHTKSSGHHKDGDVWRSELLDRLVGAGRASLIESAFSSDARLGCVAPEGHVLPLSVYWGWNEDNVRYLCLRMGLPDPVAARDRFVAGSMCWIRLAALRPLLDAHLGEWEFAPEGGHIDGTMAHAVERALSLSVQGAGYHMATAAEVCGIAFDDGAPYAYAEASQPTRSSVDLPRRLE